MPIQGGPCDDPYLAVPSRMTNHADPSDKPVLAVTSRQSGPSHPSRPSKPLPWDTPTRAASGSKRQSIPTPGDNPFQAWTTTRTIPHDSPLLTQAVSTYHARPDDKPPLAYRTFLA